MVTTLVVTLILTVVVTSLLEIGPSGFVLAVGVVGAICFAGLYTEQYEFVAIGMVSLFFSSFLAYCKFALKRI